MNQETAIQWGIALGLTAIVSLLGWWLGPLLLRRVAAVSNRTPTDIDDLFLESTRPHVPVWSLLLGALVGVTQAPIPPEIRTAVARGAQVAFLFSVTILCARFLGELVRRKSGFVPGGLPTSTLTQNLVRAIVIGLGLLVIAGQLGIAITPLLTALGVGSLAVALALQPTLTNLFAGVHISLARQVRVGDFVELDQGMQGYVVDIGWRSTQIRELSNNLIIVPNSRLAEIVLKNYSLPETEQAALVQIGVSYSSNLRKVERVTIEVARETLREVEGGVAAFDPFIRFHTFGDSSIDFTVILRVGTFIDRYLVSHEFIKRLHDRYDQEGIEIPFPQRVLHAPMLPFARSSEVSAAGGEANR
jgi:small-conductance mechanosensitive channel